MDKISLEELRNAIKKMNLGPVLVRIIVSSSFISRDELPEIRKIFNKFGIEFRIYKGIDDIMVMEFGDRSYKILIFKNGKFKAYHSKLFKYDFRPKFLDKAQSKKVSHFDYTGFYEYGDTKYVKIINW